MSKLTLNNWDQNSIKGQNKWIKDWFDASSFKSILGFESPFFSLVFIICYYLYCFVNGLEYKRTNIFFAIYDLWPHLILPLPGIFFPQISTWLPHSLPSGFWSCGVSSQPLSLTTFSELAIVLSVLLILFDFLQSYNIYLYLKRNF